MDYNKKSVQIAVAVTASLATTPEIRITDQVVGEIILSATAASGITSLTFYASIQSVGQNPAPGLPAGLASEYVTCADVGTSGVLTVAAGNAYQFPTQLIGAGFIKIVANTPGTVYLNLKG